jgi:hypothetical protein
MHINIKKGNGIVILDGDEARAVVIARSTPAKTTRAIELALSNEFGAVGATIQALKYYKYLELYEIKVHLWIATEGGPPDVYDFTLKESKIY